MGGRADVGIQTTLARLTAWLGIIVVLVCVFVVAFGHDGSGDSIDLFGAFLFVGMPAIPLGLIANGRLHRPFLAVISSALIVIVEVLVVVAFLRDTHSTAAVGFLYSMAAAWVIWALTVAVERAIESRNRPLPPRPDRSE
jgi:hypothetical protein